MKKILIGFLLLASVLCRPAFAYQGSTSTHYHYDIHGVCVGEGVPNHFFNGANPAAMAAEVGAFLFDTCFPTDYATAGYTQAVAFGYSGAGSTWTLCGGRAPGGTGCFGAVYVNTSDGISDTCWESHHSSFTSGVYYSDAPSGFTCDLCPSGKEWDAVSHSCKAPDCDSDEEFDTEINACRATCDSDKTYQYSSSSCVTKCPSGGVASPWLLLSNKPIPYDPDTFTVNGCPATYTVVCEPEVDPHHYTSQYFTGQMCLGIFRYKEPVVNVTIVSQAEAEAECHCSLAFGGEGSTPVKTGVASDATLQEQATQLPGVTEPADIVEMHTICQAGVRKLAVTVNGTLEEVNYLGSCPLVNEPVVSGGTEGGGGVQQTQISDDVKAIKTVQSDDHTTLNTVADGLSSIKTALGVSAPGDDPPDGGTFVPPGAICPDGQYKDPGGECHGPLFPDGITGAIGTGDLGDTELNTFLHSLVPNLGDAGASCPSFLFPGIRPFIGEFTFTPYCAVWDVLGGMVLAFASFIAWCIVWRV